MIWAKKKVTPPSAKIGSYLRKNCMDIIPYQGEHCQVLGFRWNGNGSEFLDYDLPHPNLLVHLTTATALACWLIDGRFDTKKGKDYLADIVARFLLSFAEYKPQRINRLIQPPETAHTDKKIHKLKEFRGLKSLPKTRKAFDRSCDAKDPYFWALKFEAEYQIRDYGIINYQQFERFAFAHFGDCKDASTLRAKCRSIFYWYQERDFKTTLLAKENAMTRQEASAVARATLEKETKAKVVAAVSYLTFMNEKVNVSTVAKQAKASRNTVAKYLQELNLKDKKAKSETRCELIFDLVTPCGASRG